jgi:nucleoside-diphosphate-sugar epimerase
MHALVTGGGGFLGRYIVEQLLARGDRVRILNRRAYPKLEKVGVDVVCGDIRSRDAVAAACRDIDCVFHAAAMPGISLRAHVYDEINRVGTENVIYGCRNARVPRLVYTSSPSVVFAGDDQCGVDEFTPYDTHWLKAHCAYYSLSKAQAERAVLEAHGEHLSSCALRPHLIWGPRDTHLIPRLIARARSGRLRRVGDGTNLVDITYVENAAEAHLWAADLMAAEPRTAPGNSPGGKAYFLSQGEPVNCWQWIDEILALAGLPPVKKSISFATAWRLGHLFETGYQMMGLSAEPPMTRFLAAQLAKSHWFDISAAQRDLGYRPRVSTEEGMRQLGVWLRELAGETPAPRRP